jgi:hypothetical protein
MRNKTMKWLRVPVCAVFATAATFGAVAQQQAAPGPNQIKAALLRPAGWIANWAKPGDVGQSEIAFEARGDKVVAKIRNLTYPTTCEKDVTITSDAVKFDGCYDWNITLRFDPNNKGYPFKGKSGKGYDYKLQPKEVG